MYSFMAISLLSISLREFLPFGSISLCNTLFSSAYFLHTVEALLSHGDLFILWSLGEGNLIESGDF